MAPIVAEPALQCDFKAACQHHVVAHFGVDVERDVRRIERDVAVDERADPAVAPLRSAARCRPRTGHDGPAAGSAAPPFAGAAPSMASSEASTAATIRSTEPRFWTCRPLTALGSSGISRTRRKVSRYSAISDTESRVRSWAILPPNAVRGGAGPERQGRRGPANRGPGWAHTGRRRSQDRTTPPWARRCRPEPRAPRAGTPGEGR